MDTLTFAAPILYRHLTFSEAKKAPISEISLEKALQGLEMNMSHVGGAPTYPDCSDRARVQFIDLCILLGCDYLEPIKGVGPKSALKLIREYDGLQGVVEHLREKQVVRGIWILKNDLLPPDKPRRKTRPLMLKRAARRRKGASKFPRSGPGKKPRNCFRNQTCCQLQKSR
jgi:5'-3' exonuclease